MFVIFHPFVQKPPWTVCTKFGTAIWVAEIIVSDNVLVIG